ncbi:MAG: chromosome segregation SMC family protein [Candidatus Thorarchaeota archaeon]|nr:chromosome segregation SMC family protein [Candidatus Thorarchaeota archaeon]
MRKFDTHIESVKLKNFLSFYEGVVEFDPGLTVIVGPNGSGKTSIFHAVKFALGSNQRENRYSKWSDFIRHGASSAETEVVARVNGQSRKFQRKISRDGIPRSYVDGKRVKAAELQKIVNTLGFDIDNPLVFMPQERINAIRDMDPIEVRKLVEEGTGLSILRDRIYLEEAKVQHSRQNLDAARSEAKVVERELEMLQSDLDRLERKRELQKNEALLDHEVKWATVDDLSAKIVETRKEIEEKELGLGEVLEEIVELEDSISSHETESKKIGQEASNLQRETGSISARIDEEERRLNRIESETKQTLDEIRELEKRIKVEKRTMDKTKEDLRRIGAAKEQMLEDQKQTTAELDTIEEDRTRIENELAAFAEWNAKRSEAQGTYRALQTDVKGKDLLFRSIQEKLQNDEADLQAIESKSSHIWSTLEGTDEKELAIKKGQFEREIASLNEKRFKSVTQVSQLQKEIDDIKLRLSESSKRIPDSVLELAKGISEHNLETVTGPLVEILATKEEYASALEAVVLGDMAFTFLVEDEAEFTLLQRLRDNLGAPAPIIFLKNLKKHSEKVELPTWKGVIGFLWDLLGFDPEMVARMRCAFGNYVVTRDRQTTARTAERSSLQAVSLDGQRIEPASDRIISHPKREPTGVIATAPLQARLSSAESEIVIARNLVTDVMAGIEKATAGRDEIMDLISQVTRWSGTWERRKKLREMIPQQEERLVGLDDEIKNLQLECGKAERALKKLDNTQPPERGRLIGQQSAARMKYRKMREQLTQIEARLQATQNDQANKRQDLRSFEENTKMLSERSQELREEIASSKSEGSKIVDLIENLRESLEQTHLKYQSLMSQQSEIKGEIWQLSERLLEINLQVKNSRILVVQAKRHLDMFQHQKSEIDKELKGSKRPKSVRNIEIVRDELLRVRHQLEEYRDVSETVAHTETQLKDQLAELSTKVGDIQDELNEAEETVMDIRKQYLDGMNEVLGKVESEINSILSTVRFSGEIKFQLSVVNQVYGVDFKTRIKTEEFGALSAGSGGERSLIAIGLILALQRFNPAPVYAMDEIDTFLDATNTELVSRLLHDSSRRSQFILFTPAKSTHLLRNADKRLGVVSPGGKEPSVVIESPKFVDQ